MTRSSIRARARRTRQGRARNQRGAVAVEFALITPMLLLLVFGIIEFGYMFNRDTIVSNASRDGARVASLGGTYDDICLSIKTELSQAAIPVPTSCGTPTTPTASVPTVIIIDCKKADNSACNASNATTYDSLAVSGTTATVRVSYRYSWVTPVISQLYSASTLTQFTQMRVE